MDADKFPPGHGLLALGSWREATALEDVADRLIANEIAKIFYSSDNAVIAPRAVLTGQPHHQGFEFLVNPRTANGPVWLGGVTLLIDACAVPGENRVRRGNRRDLCQDFLAQFSPYLGERSAVAVGERHTPVDLLAEQAILGDQVRIAQPELFVYRCGDRPQQLLPVHASLTLPQRLPWMISMGESAMKFKVKYTSWWSVTYERAMRLDILAIRP
jgi:hypothetical protein